MAKQIAGLDALFQQVNPYGAEVQAVSQQTQGQPHAPGKSQGCGSPRGQPTFLPLSQVWPDPNQPRRLLPPTIAERFEQAKDAAEALDAWARLGRDGDATAAKSYAELESLANSIASDGLIQPVIVVPSPDGEGNYILESGERRWWAHQLLAKQGRAAKDGQAGHVEAIIRRPAQATIVRQLAENLHRSDLCAVEVAAGLGALIAEIEGESGTVVPLSSGERLTILRTIADRRLREGTWAEVTKRLGKSRRHWAHYLSILHLSNDALTLALYHHLAERALRDAVAEQDPARQLALVKAAVKQQQREQDREEGDDGEPAKPASAAKQDNAIVLRRQLVSGLRGFGRAAQSLDGGKVNTRDLVKELADDKHYDEVVAAARQMLPVLEAVVKSASKHKQGAVTGARSGGKRERRN